MDAGYGNNTALRTGIGKLGLRYVAGILSSTSVWAPDTMPLPPKAWSGLGRPPNRLRRDAKHRPISVKALALGLPKRVWRTIRWREGSADWMSSRFARVRVRAAHRDTKLAKGRPEEWLLIEWPEGETEPVLARHRSRRHALRPHGRSCQVALAHRARLSGAQARTRSRSL